jgi:hypothetical protein
MDPKNGRGWTVIEKTTKMDLLSTSSLEISPENCKLLRIAMVHKAEKASSFQLLMRINNYGKGYPAGR